MFIRTKTKKDLGSNKIYTSYQLVESYRTHKGPRQKIHLTIGSNITLDRQERKELANCIEELITGTQTLFPRDEKIEQLAEEFAEKLKQKHLKTSSATVRVDQTEEPPHSPFVVFKLWIHTRFQKPAIDSGVVGMHSLMKETTSIPISHVETGFFALFDSIKNNQKEPFIV